MERRWHDVELIAGLLLKHGRITPEIDEVLPLEAVEEGRGSNENLKEETERKRSEEVQRTNCR